MACLPVLKRLLTFVRAERPVTGLDRSLGEIGAEIAARDAHIEQQIGLVLKQLEQAVKPKSQERPVSFLRSGLAAAAAGLCAQLVAPGCAGSSKEVNETPPTVHSSPSTVASDTSQTTSASTSTSLVHLPSNQTALPKPTTTKPDATTSPPSSKPSPSATSIRVDPRTLKMWKAQSKMEKTVSRCLGFICYGLVYIKLGRYGQVTQVSSKDTFYGPAKLQTPSKDLTPRVKACIMAALAYVRFPHFAGETIEIRIDGACD